MLLPHQSGIAIDMVWLELVQVHVTEDRPQPAQGDAVTPLRVIFFLWHHLRQISVEQFPNRLGFPLEIQPLSPCSVRLG